VPSINVRGRGSITQNGNLYVSTKLESIRQSDKPELISPKNSFMTRLEHNETRKDLGLERAAAPTFRGPVLVGFRQSARWEVRRPPLHFLVTLTDSRKVPHRPHGLLDYWKVLVVIWDKLWPQQRQSPRFMWRCRSVGVNRPSAPRTLLMGALRGRGGGKAPGKDRVLGAHSMW